MSLTATILILYAACLAGAIASPPAPGPRDAARSPSARRLPAGLLAPALALLAAGLLPQPARAGEAALPPVSGPATVIDGGTLEVAGRRLRLDGIDAPGLDQTCFDAAERSYACGRAAAEALAARIGGAAVTCAPRRSDAAGTSALCRLGAEDLAAFMVASGHALADRRVSDAYAAQDERAWGRRLGLWSGVFERPADWRRTRQAADAPDTARIQAAAFVPAR